MFERASKLKTGVRGTHGEERSTEVRGDDAPESGTAGEEECCKVRALPDAMRGREDAEELAYTKRL